MYHIISNIFILIFMPFLLIGIINKTKAFWAGRLGPSIIQPIFDFIKLMKKGMVISHTTSLIFIAAPVIQFSSILLAGLLVPISHKSIISFDGSFIIFLYLLGTGKFFSLIGAMDTGSSFEGMGASRESSFSTIAEPSFFILLASISALTNTYTFEGLFGGLFSFVFQKAGGFGFLIAILSGLAIFILVLAEGCRVPVDDPNTHLELTMIHEVMILDNSGFDLGLIFYGSAMKMLILLSLITAIIIPQQIRLIYSIIFYLVLMCVLGVTIGTIESSIARMRMSRVFEFIFSATSLSLIVLSLIAINLYSH